MNAVDQGLHELAEFVDALLALGARSQSADSLARGRRIALSLEDAGLTECARALAQTVDALSDAESSSAGDRTARLCAVLESAREARRLEQLSDSASGDDRR